MSLPLIPRLRHALALVLVALLTACGPGGPPTITGVPTCTETVRAETCSTLTLPYSLSQANDFYDLGSIPVVPSPGLGDYYATFDSLLQPVIYYDPWLNLPLDVHNFFIAHEVGHHALAHLYNYPPALLSGDMAKCLEYEADCYAARVMSARSPSAVQAAASFFRNPSNFVNDGRHPQPCMRAELIEDWAAEARAADPLDLLHPSGGSLGAP